MRRYHNHPIFIMEIPIPGKTVFILRQGPSAEAVKFHWSSKKVMPVKFQSDWKTISPKLMAGWLHELWQEDVIGHYIRALLIWAVQSTSRRQEVLFDMMNNGTANKTDNTLHIRLMSGLILGLRPANERRRYKVTPSLIGWAQTYNQPWMLYHSKQPPNISVRQIKCFCYNDNSSWP